MEDVKTPGTKLRRIILLLLVTALVVLSCVAFEAVHTRNEIQTTVTELCGQTMKNIELNLRQGDDISPEALYRYHQITQIFPETYYAVLADTLMPLEDPSLSSQLTQEDRIAIADCIAQAYDEDMKKEEWEPLIYDIENILAPYMYN